MESVMPGLKFTLAATTVALLLGACAREEKPEGVIPQGYKDAVNKAQGVEGTLQDSLQMRDEEINAGEH
jgi:hypothetical protein